MTDKTKPERGYMRLPQNNKRNRLTRRHLGQWHAKPQALPKLLAKLVPET